MYRIMPLIGVLILLSGVVNLYQRSNGWLGFLYTVLFSALFFSMPLFGRRAALKIYAKMPERDKEVTWAITDESICIKTELASSEIKWGFYQKAIRAREGFLVSPDVRTFHWLPMHAFRDAGDAERFAELAKSKVSEYKQMV